MSLSVSESLRAVPHRMDPLSIEISRRVGQLVREIYRMNAATTIESPPMAMEIAPMSGEAGPGDVVDVRA